MSLQMKESSELDFRGTLLQSACLFINVVWYFQKFGDNDILQYFENYTVIA